MQRLGGSHCQVWIAGVVIVFASVGMCNRPAHHFDCQPVQRHLYPPVLALQDDGLGLVRFGPVMAVAALLNRQIWSWLSLSERTAPSGTAIANTTSGYPTAVAGAKSGYWDTAKQTLQDVLEDTKLWSWDRESARTKEEGASEWHSYPCKPGHYDFNSNAILRFVISASHIPNLLVLRRPGPRSMLHYIPVIPISLIVTPFRPF